MRPLGAWLGERAAWCTAWLRWLRRDDSGATALEYSLIAVFIAALIVAVVTVLGGQVSVDFSSVIGKF